jgi:hypothetical protein
MKRGLVLVEGQTEERFVNDVLAPAFRSYDFHLTPTLLITKRVKSGAHFRGGVTTYGKMRNDLKRLLNTSGGAVVTTIIDYYGLPADTPGMKTRPNASPLDRVIHIEEHIRRDLGSPKNFLPFLALHEFEAWLFSSADELPRALTSKSSAFAAVCAGFDNPEDIDEGPTTAPSKRILEMFPSYRKALHGPLTAQRIGLDRIRSRCPHFAAWLSALQNIVS